MSRAFASFRCSWRIVLTLLPVLVSSDVVPYEDGLTEGQGFNSFLGKGEMHGAVSMVGPRSERRRGLAAYQNMPYRFSSPSGNLTGIDPYSYFMAPDAYIGSEFERRDTHDTTKESTQTCSGSLRAETKLVKNYREYLTALGVSASATLSGWGQRASISGEYLDQAKISGNTLTYVATFEVKKQLDFGYEFSFNTLRYQNDTFAEMYGDRFIRGFHKGGKMIVRVTVTEKNKKIDDTIKSSVQTSLSYLSVGGDVGGELKRELKKLNDNANVEFSVFYQGELGKSKNEGKPQEGLDISSIEESLKNVRLLAERFRDDACAHSYRYHVLLDEHTNVLNFPPQAVHDYSSAKTWAFTVLSKMVKISEMSSYLQEQDKIDGSIKEDIEISQNDMKDLVMNWLHATAKNPDNVAETAKALLKELGTSFFDRYKKYLPQASSTATSHQPASPAVTRAERSSDDCEVPLEASYKCLKVKVANELSFNITSMSLTQTHNLDTSHATHQTWDYIESGKPAREKSIAIDPRFKERWWSLEFTTPERKLYRTAANIFTGPWEMHRIAEADMAGLNVTLRKIDDPDGHYIRYDLISANGVTGGAMALA